MNNIRHIVEVIQVMKVRDFTASEIIGHSTKGVTPDSHIQLTINKHGFPWSVDMSEDETRRLYKVLGRFLALFDREE